MYLVLASAIIVNILSIIVLFIGLVYNFNQPKNKAIYGYSIAGSMLFYIIILSVIALYDLFINKLLYFLILLLCVISPFVIGKLVKHETLKKYTVIQIVCFVVSLVTLIMNF